MGEVNHFTENADTMIHAGEKFWMALLKEQFGIYTRFYNGYLAWENGKGRFYSDYDVCRK